jgi:hypothetical protein
MTWLCSLMWIVRRQGLKPTRELPRGPVAKLTLDQCCFNRLEWANVDTFHSSTAVNGGGFVRKDGDMTRVRTVSFVHHLFNVPDRKSPHAMAGAGS